MNTKKGITIMNTKRWYYRTFKTYKWMYESTKQIQYLYQAKEIGLKLKKMIDDEKQATKTMVIK